MDQKSWTKRRLSPFSREKGLAHPRKTSSLPRKKKEKNNGPRIERRVKRDKKKLQRTEVEKRTSS